MKIRSEPLLARQRRKFHFEALQQFADAEIGHLGLHRTGVEPRNVEQRGEYFFDRLQRGVDILHQARVLARILLALDQAGHVKSCGVERLQDVVARRGDKARLRDVGIVGLGLGALKLGVEPRQLAGAFADAALQRGVGALQRLRGLHARRDIGESGNEAAIGHAVGADFDHQPALGNALEKRLGFRRVLGEPLRDLIVEVPHIARTLAWRYGEGSPRARYRCG